MEEVPLTPAPGGGAQEFRLQWKNFSTNLATSLDIFKNEKDFVDVTLVCEGQQLLAHRMLLCACSPYFRNLIKANPCPHPIIILSNEVKYTDLEKLLDFMYQGSVNVVQEHLARFLKTAEMLKIRGLADDDKKSMQPVQHPSSPCLSNSGTITPNDCGSSPKRPRLSLDNNNPCTSTSSTTLNNSSSTNNSYSNNTTGTPPTTLACSVNLDTPNTPSNIEESTHSANDSDSEMLPVKQEMVELKSCDEFETDADQFIPEAYLKEGVGLSTSEGGVQGAGQGPPPPPGALRPSYVPPPPIKAQEDCAPSNAGADELSQGSPPFLFSFPLNSTPMRPPLNLSGNTFSTPTSTRVKKRRSPKSFPPSYASVVPNSSSLPPPPLYTNSAFRTPSRKTPPGFSPYSSDRTMNGDSPINCISSPISPKVEGTYTSPENLRVHKSSPEESGIPHGYSAASLLASAYAAAAAGNGRHSPHILAQTNKDNARLTCEQCQKSFTSRSNLNKHKRVQHSGEEFICTYCGSKFKNRYYIKEHTALCVASCQKKAAAAAAAAVMAVSAGNTPMRPKSAGNENMKCSPPSLVSLNTSPTSMNYTLASVTPTQPVVQMAGQPAPSLPLPTMVAAGQPALPTMLAGQDTDVSRDDDQPTDLAIHSRNNSHSMSDGIALTNENSEIL